MKQKSKKVRKTQKREERKSTEMGNCVGWTQAQTEKK